MYGARETRENSKMGHRHDLLTLSKLSLKLSFYHFICIEFQTCWGNFLSELEVMVYLTKEKIMQIFIWQFIRWKYFHIHFIYHRNQSCVCQRIAKLENTGNPSPCTKCNAKYQVSHISVQGVNYYEPCFVRFHGSILKVVNKRSRKKHLCKFSLQTRTLQNVWLYI